MCSRCLRHVHSAFSHQEHPQAAFQCHKARNCKRRLWDPETGGLLAALALSPLPGAPEGAAAHADGKGDGAAADHGGGRLHAGCAAEREAAEEAAVPGACAAGDPTAAETDPGGGPSGIAGEPEAAVGKAGAETGAECGAAAPAGQGGARSEAEAGAGDADGVLDWELAEEPGHYPRAQLLPAVLAVAMAPDGCAPRAPGWASVSYSIAVLSHMSAACLHVLGCPCSMHKGMAVGVRAA